MRQREGGKQSGGVGGELRVNAPPAAEERVLGCPPPPPPGPPRVGLIPPNASWASATGWRRDRPLSPAQAGAHLGGPARPDSPEPRFCSPGVGVGGVWVCVGAVSPLILTNCSNRAIRSDSQAFMGWETMRATADSISARLAEERRLTQNNRSRGMADEERGAKKDRKSSDQGSESLAVRV